MIATVDRGLDDWPALGDAERARLDRLLRADDRAAYAMAHGLLRTVFTRLTARSPDELQLAYEPGGRPFIRGMEHLRISLSHARTAVAVAIGWDVAVGIDVEVTTGEDPDDGLLDIALTDAERELVRTGATAADRERLFLRLWTAKEALLKANGLGVTAGLSSICLAQGLDRASLPGPLGLPQDWRLAHHEAGAILGASAFGAGLRDLVLEMPAGGEGAGVSP